MEIQSLIRDRVIGNIKIGKKGKNGIPQKLTYFNVEQDKATTNDVVEVFKQLYPDKPEKLRIRFTTENPFSWSFKKYVNGSAICIGNGEKARTVGKDAKNNKIEIAIPCNENCENRKTGKCKLKGSLKFVLDGIDAGGVWNLSTSGGMSLSNIYSEIEKYKKQNISIVNVPFDLTLIEQQSLAYGTYYSIDLHRADIKPTLIEDTTVKKLSQANNEDSKELNAEIKDIENSNEKENTKTTEVTKEPKKENEEIDYSKLCQVNKIIPTLIKGQKFNKIIFDNATNKTVEYILHPEANKDVLKLGIGTVIYITETSIQAGIDILCRYEIKQVMNPDGSLSEYNENKIKEAV